jgi:uroporphyrinogen decarboxylase
MGGINKRGIIVGGTKEEIEARVQNILDNAPEKFILGASCTLPGNINWGNIRNSIDEAHNYEK